MKVFVEHDDQGNIQSVGVPVSTSDTRTTLKPQPGYQVVEVEVSHVLHEQDIEHLREIKQHYRIEGYPGQARLVRK